MRRYTRLIYHPVLHSFIWRQVLGSACVVNYCLDILAARLRDERACDASVCHDLIGTEEPTERLCQFQRFEMARASTFVREIVPHLTSLDRDVRRLPPCLGAWLVQHDSSIWKRNAVSFAALRKKHSGCAICLHERGGQSERWDVGLGEVATQETS